MMKAILKTLAISFGGGLALGAGFRLSQGPKTRREPASGLGPLVERLKHVESRIVAMETSSLAGPAAAAPAPSAAMAALESRLAAQVSDVEQLRGEMVRVDRRLGELDAQIPDIVQSTVEVRFQDVEQRLERNFEEAQTRSIAAFVETLQSKVVERITALEADLEQQSEAIGKLRDTSLRADENLQKMLAGIERLAGQGRTPEPPPPTPSAPIPAAPVKATQPAEARAGAAPTATPQGPVPHDTQQRPQLEEPAPAVASVAPAVSEAPHETPIPTKEPGITQPQPLDAVHSRRTAFEPVPTPPAESDGRSAIGEPIGGAEPTGSEESFEWVNRIGLELLAPRSKPRPAWRIPLTVGISGGILLLGSLYYSGILQSHFDAKRQTSALASTSPAMDPSLPSMPANSTEAPLGPVASKPGDPASLLDLGREYTRRKDWGKAEAAYRSALEASPTNRDAALGLSDVLYQEQKYEESAAVLNRLASARSRN